MVKADDQKALVALLRSLRAQYNETTVVFGARLGALTGADRTYSATYVHMMENEKKRIPPIVARALHSLAGMQVMVCPAQGVQLTPGCIVQKAERACRRTGCRVRFIPDGKAEYCSEACRKLKRKNLEH